MEELINWGIPSAVIATAIGFYYTTRIKLKTIEDKNKKQDEILDDIRKDIELKASKQMVKEIKADLEKYMDRMENGLKSDIAEIKASLKDLNKLVLQLINKK